MTVGIILLTVGMIMYFINPEKSQDLNSFYAGIVSGLLSMATLCLVSVVWIVTGWISLNDGDILFQQIAETISSSLPVFKRKKYKKEINLSVIKIALKKMIKTMNDFKRAPHAGCSIKLCGLLIRDII